MPEWNQYVREHLASLRLDSGREAEIIDEVSQHLDQRFDELLSEGATEEDARQRVIQELNEPDALAAYMRPLRQAHVAPAIMPGKAGAHPFTGFWRDLRIAVRALRKKPVFAATAVVTLALAIGANTAIFSVVHTVLIRPLAFPESDRLVVLRGTAPGSELSGEFGLGAEFYLQYKNAKTLEDLAFYNTVQTTMRADSHVERLFVTLASPSLFSTLRVKPIIGRLPTEKDEGASVVVLSHWLWVQWFNSDPSVLGRAVDISNATRTVIGVMGPDLRFPTERTAVWMNDRVSEPVRPGGFGLSLIGRLAPGADHDSVRSELAPLARRLPERFGATGPYAQIIEKHLPVVRSLEDFLLGDLKRPLWILMGTVGVVLLIGCANVANLLIVRAESRRRDMAVRSALGAGRGALVRAQLAEAIVLALCGGAGGVLLAWAGVPLIVRAAPDNIPRLSSVAVDGTALLFTAGVVILAALACGLLPAIRFSRREIMDGLRTLRSGESSYLTRDTLVVVQTAAALVLLVGSALLFQSFVKLRNVNAGFDIEDIFTFQAAPDPRRHWSIVDGPTVAKFHYDFMDRMASLPGVQSVGLVDRLPFDEGAGAGRFVTERSTTEHPLRMTFADGNYFRTMGIQLLRGNTFTRNTTPVGDPVGVIVSRSTAELLWPGQNPLGKRLRPSSGPPQQMGWMEVTGVVEDVRVTELRQPSPDPMVYLPMVGHQANSWIVGTPAYVVKTPRAETIAPEIREIINQIAPEAPMYRVFTMRELAARTMANLTFMMMTLAIAAGLALILGAVGLYGTLSYMVSQRTREIGIRMALGAQSKEVRRMIVRHGSRVAVIGVAAGLIVAFLLTRLLNTMLFGVAPIDLFTFGLVPVVMLGVALLASYIPARRASSVDPIVSLRSE